MGVAVMISRSGCGPPDFSRSATRWCTPKRCCSSTTARPSREKSTPSWMRAWVPTTTSTVPLGHGGQHPGPIGRVGGEQGHAHPHQAGQRLQPEEVLLGEDLGGGHDRPLVAALDRDEQGRHRHHRLARAHLALEEAVHGVRARPCRRGSRRWPAPGPRSGGRAGPPRKPPPGRPRRCGRCPPPPRSGGACAGPGPSPGGTTRRTPGGPGRPRPRPGSRGSGCPAITASRETRPRRATRSRRERVGDGPRAGHGVGQELLQAPRGHPGHRRVDRDDAPRAAVGRPAQHVDHGGLHLQPAPEALHLPGEGHLRARGQLALAEGLVEEGDPQRPEDVGGHPGGLLGHPAASLLLGLEGRRRQVGPSRGGERPATPRLPRPPRSRPCPPPGPPPGSGPTRRAPHRDSDDDPHHGDLDPQRHPGDGGHQRAVDVAPGEVEEEIGHAWRCRPCAARGPAARPPP